jgi:hypothetical protein
MLQHISFRSVSLNSTYAVRHERYRHVRDALALCFNYRFSYFCGAYLPRDLNLYTIIEFSYLVIAKNDCT